MLGPLMIGIASTELSPKERELLQSEQVCGVILFTRNYKTSEQLIDLILEIQKTRKAVFPNEKLLIGVDQEGGNVQRFQGNHFTRLPKSSDLGKLYELKPQKAIALAEKIGWVTAIDLAVVGIDFSFSPVVDLGQPGTLPYESDRAFHKDPRVVEILAEAYIKGMKKAGMLSIIKHFPGHGTVKGDSHCVLPKCDRTMSDVKDHDMLPFANLIKQDLVFGLMCGHLLFPNIDSDIVSYSKFWLHEILRKDLNFDGCIFSDAFEMHAASSWADDPCKRIEQNLLAGCDVIPICHGYTDDYHTISFIISFLQRFPINVDESLKRQVRISNLHFTKTPQVCLTLLDSPRYKIFKREIENFCEILASPTQALEKFAFEEIKNDVANTQESPVMRF
ncbi:MAG: beta-N-acetylhexosaminidase [Gammaproteobacteria bacterium]|nr:beta-N-acetylhexosaminidase [Gammaproteobacteria bacterium]